MNLPQQLLLDLKLDHQPGFDNFVAGGNAELLSRLRRLPEPSCHDAIYVWGPSGCGKSHLLAATALATTQRPVVLAQAVTMAATMAADREPEPGTLLIIDAVEALDPEAQISLFRSFNSARFLGLAILLCGQQPPLRLPLREDLRTRIGQALIYEVQPLTDNEKGAALHRHARERGMPMDESLVHYLLRHGRRDLPSLMKMLDHLDRASLQQKRPPTVPLLKELLQTSQESSPS